MSGVLLDEPLSAEDEAYIKRLTSYSVSGLEKEPRSLQQEIKRLNNEIEELAVGNYQTFVESSHCVDECSKSTRKMDQTLSAALQSLPKFAQRCQHFTSSAKRLREAQKLNKVMVENQMQLLELLEIPQLMDNCVRTGLYEEALDLEAYARSLQTRHPDIPILQHIMREVEFSLTAIKSQLLQMLQGSITLSTCLRVIGYLRRLNTFHEAALRAQFLRSRDHWLEKCLNDINSPDPYEYILKYMDCNRTALFEIVTQYRAIFSDDSSSTEDMDRTLHDSERLFYWIHQRIQNILKTIRNALPQLNDASLLQTVLEQCMYCGLSLSRVGIDFRFLVIPMFEERIVDLFKSHLETLPDAFSDSLSRYDWYLSKDRLVSLGVSAKTDISKPTNELSPEAPPDLMQFPPLVIVANGFAKAFNQLRHCAPLSIRDRVVTLCADIIKSMAEILRRMSSLTYPTHDGTSGWMKKTIDTSNPVVRLAQAQSELFIPHINRVLWLVFVSLKNAPQYNLLPVESLQAELSDLYQDEADDEDAVEEGARDEATHEEKTQECEKERNGLNATEPSSEANGTLDTVSDDVTHTNTADAITEESTDREASMVDGNDSLDVKDDIVVDSAYAQPEPVS